jgi:diguanylate cyclase (GGDEF)-like protein
MAISLIVALGFCITCAAALWQERRNVWEHAGQTATSLVTAINSDIARNIEQYDLSLQGVIEGLKLPELRQVSPRTRQAILFDHSATALYMGSIRVLNENGAVTIDSRTLNPSPDNFADREFFQVHRDNANRGMYLSRPFNARNGEYVMAISRRISRPDGAFGGVVVGTLRLAYFHELFRKVAPTPRSSLTLFGEDGTIIMRLPMQSEDIGRVLANAEVLKFYPQKRSGRYQRVALLDGLDRFYSFSQVEDFPLLMVVGLPVDEVYAGWRQEALILGLLMLALCGATIFSAVLLRKELARRVAAERQLAILATTDSLTGLSNRRHFDQVIEREWQRAMREETPLSILMIDADWFKKYNDTHGHQSGDMFLQAIGQAIGSKLRRVTDLAARYGGEEFAVLLPGTGTQGALEIAERIRAGVADLALQQVAIADMPTVSVGVASIVPRSASNHRMLIDAADKALYEAKHKGRNRTEVAELLAVPDPKPRMVA